MYTSATKENLEYVRNEKDTWCPNKMKTVTVSVRPNLKGSGSASQPSPVSTPQTHTHTPDISRLVGTLRKQELDLWTVVTAGMPIVWSFGGREEGGDCKEAQPARIRGFDQGASLLRHTERDEGLEKISVVTWLRRIDEANKGDVRAIEKEGGLCEGMGGTIRQEALVTSLPRG
ncbi:hypothetical protein ElyMa_000390900 [Elysia marginata]|uniref:Uncharacterized protein n=1 Tax=Elysia marginata TaxID=1093978 RepID=A0AAV4FHM2_9GAST|nr:hypothetical protein ElyMa_000390900 [Elysia marginata]